MPADNLIEKAEQAAEGSDFPEAIRLWRLVMVEQPGLYRPAFGLVDALIGANDLPSVLAFARDIEAGQPGLADLVLRRAVKAAPADVAIRVAYCASAERREDWEEAVQRWTGARHRLSRISACHIGYINAVTRQGRLDEAERAAGAALKVLGNRAELLEVHAGTAEARGDWDQAAARWELLAQTSPAYPHSAARLHAARLNASLQEPAPKPQAASIPHVDRDDAAECAEIKKLLTNFESLGRNCEFGLLQRAFGAEPLGLLRFSVASPAMIIQLLKSRFEGFGDPERNELFVRKIEYWFRHKPTQWRTHTKLTVHRKNDPAVIFNTQLKHTRFLRDKLVKDLDRQTKIAVYQLAQMKDSEIEAIYDALQAYGPNMLLCVRVSTEQYPAGTVLWPHDRLMVAHIDRQGVEFTGAGFDISVDYWVHFCRMALERRAALGNAGVRDETAIAAFA